MNTSKTLSKKWYNDKQKLIWACLFFYPLGLYGIWKNPNVKNKWRILYSTYSLFALLITIAIFSIISIEPEVNVNTKAIISSSEALSYGDSISTQRMVTNWILDYPEVGDASINGNGKKITIFIQLTNNLTKEEVKRFGENRLKNTLGVLNLYKLDNGLDNRGFFQKTNYNYILILDSPNGDYKGIKNKYDNKLSWSPIY